jgi:hypothetical protein
MISSLGIPCLIPKVLIIPKKKKKERKKERKNDIQTKQVNRTVRHKSRIYMKNKKKNYKCILNLNMLSIRNI